MNKVEWGPGFCILPPNKNVEKEKLIVTGMIVNTEICSKVVGMMGKGGIEFSTYHTRKIAGWAKGYYEQNGKAPQKDIQFIYEQNIDRVKEAESEMIRIFLTQLQQNFTAGDVNTYSPDVMVPMASGVFAHNIEDYYHQRITDLRDQGKHAEADKLVLKRTEALARLSSGSGEEFKLMSYDDMQEYIKTQPEISWVVQDLISDSGLTILASRPKVGKSTLAMSLMANVISGRPFLGRSTRSGPVFYFLCPVEGDGRRLIQQFEKLGMFQNEENRKLVYAYYDKPIPADPLPQFEKMIAEYKPVLAIVDSLGGFWNIKDVNDNAEMNRLVKPFAGITRAHKCNILLISHMTKSRKEILGATSISGAGDALMYYEISKDEQDGRQVENRVLESRHRYGTPIERTIIEIDPATGFVAMGDDIWMFKVKACWRQIETMLAVNDGTLPETEILRAMGKDTNLSVAALKWGVQNNKVLRQGRGVKGSPFIFVLDRPMGLPPTVRPLSGLRHIGPKSSIKK